MRYLLDTDICSYIMKKKPLAVWQKLKQIPINEIAISAMSVAELRYGIERLGSSQFTQQVVDDFIQHLTILYWGNEETLFYGRLRHGLERQGLGIGAMDMLIAAQALSRKLTLVTNNIRHFERVPDLQIENWV